MSAGSLDPSFGTGGKVTTGLGGNDYGAAVQCDYTGTYVLSTTNGDFEVSRYLKNGKLDTSFSGDGKAYVNFGGDDHAAALSIRGSDITVVGTATYGTHQYAAVARLHFDGTFDTNFSGTGLQTLKYKLPQSFSETTATNSTAVGLGIQNDGKIVIAGTADMSRQALGGRDLEFAVARLNTDGSLDSSYGYQGMNYTEFSNNNATDHQEAQSMVMQPDGRVDVVGRSNYGWGVARFTSTGMTDSSFGSQGHISPSFGTGYEIANAVDVDASGHIIVGGFANGGNGKHAYFALAEFNSNGTPTAGFGNGGKATLSSGGANMIDDVKFQPDGKVLAFGTTTDGSSNFDIARFTTAGKLDAGFGSAGYTSIDFSGGADYAGGIGLRANKIVLAGTTTKSGNSDVALASVFSKVPVLTVNFYSNAVEGGKEGGFLIKEVGNDPYEFDTFYANYKLGGTAKLGTDYTFGADPISALYLPGQSTRFFSVDAIKDGKAEGTETVSLTLQASAAYDIQYNYDAINITDK
ncbi:MAG: hypothetical protein JWM57_2961 [Phycisphaerales bacterium]|nr:hypothetical protein [Phycisphaerales bacterium]